MEALEKGETSCPYWEFNIFLVTQPTPWSLSDNGIPTPRQNVPPVDVKELYIYGSYERSSMMNNTIY
jgi:hypothetical protein